MNAARAVPWLAAAGFATVALWAARDYGLAFDSHVWFPYGDAILAFLTRGARWPVTLRTEDFELYGSLGALGAAGASAILHDHLRLVDPVVGHHAFVVLSGAALVGLTAALGVRTGGVRTGLLAAVALATMPRFFAEAETNVSDLPAAVAWTAALVALGRALATGRLGPLVGVAVAAGALGATRLTNVPFLGAVGVAWIAADRTTRGRAMALWRQHGLTRLVALGGLAVAGLALFRPLLWYDPAGLLRRMVDRLLVPPPWMSKGVVDVFYAGELHAGGPATYHLGMLAVSTPLPLLVAALAGMVVAWRRHRPEAWLLAVWVGVSLGRHALLGRGNYDGIRHVLDALPALAVAAALGLEAGLGVLRRVAPSGRVATVAGAGGVLLAFGPGAAAIAQLHPYPVAYYNAAVGGLRGAASRFEREYSGVAYREALLWAARTLEPDDLLWVTRPYDRWLVQVEAAYLGLEHVRVWQSRGRRWPSPDGRLLTVQILRPGPSERRPAGLDPTALPVVREIQRAGVVLLRIREVPREVLPR